MTSYGRSRQLSDLRADAAFLADLPTPTTSTHITTQNLTDLINAGIAELFNLIIEACGEEVYLKTTAITTDGINYSYALPADYYKLRRVEYVTATNDTVPLHRFGPEERPFLLSTSPGWDGEPFRYNTAGKTQLGDGAGTLIELLPLPAIGKTINIAYIFCPARLVADADKLDGFAGFEDYAAVYAAHRCAVRAEKFELAGTLAAERERIRSNVSAMLSQKDSNDPVKTRLIRDNVWASRYMRVRRGYWGS